jgi:hypothetical protein
MKNVTKTGWLLMPALLALVWTGWYFGPGAQSQWNGVPLDADHFSAALARTASYGMITPGHKNLSVGSAVCDCGPVRQVMPVTATVSKAL